MYRHHLLKLYFGSMQGSTGGTSARDLRAPAGRFKIIALQLPGAVVRGVLAQDALTRALRER